MTDDRTIRHELHHALFTLKTAAKELSGDSPDFTLIAENLASAIEKLERLDSSLKPKKEKTGELSAH